MSFPGRRLLGLIARLVPESDRSDWLREWSGELAYGWSGTRSRRLSAIVVYLRILASAEDAMWMRVRNRSISMLSHDVRYAIRGLKKSPGFTSVVVLTLALGVGANVAVFALLDAVLLRPLPVHRPQELVDVYTSCRSGFQWCTTSYPDYVDYRARNRSLADLAAFGSSQVSISDGETSRRALAVTVTGNYFGLLGVTAEVGRLIAPGDDDPSAPAAVAVLSNATWRTDFGEAPEVVGSSVLVNGRAFTVVGVAPEGFTGTRLDRVPDMWLPMATVPLIDTGVREGYNRLTDRGSRWMDGSIGRRRDGVTLAMARADMASVSQQLESEAEVLPDGITERGGRSITVEQTRSATLPARDQADIRRFVAFLMAVVGTALLIACANIANLQLSRASTRRQEIAVRMALGAGRTRLVKQLLVESLTLAVLGAGAALVVATFILSRLAQYSLPGFVSIATVGARIDARVLAFAAAVTLGSAILFGLVPALQSSNQNISDSMKCDPVDRRPAAMRTRNLLLTVQSALALVLLVAAALFVQSLRSGLATDLGYRTSNLALAAVDLGAQGYSQPPAAGFLDRWVEGVSAAVGSGSVSTAMVPPMSPYGWGFFAQFPGYQPGPEEDVRIEANFVGPDYLSTMGIPLTAGRDFTRADGPEAPMVAVVNRTIVDRYFGGRNPVGARFTMGWGYEIEIVGYVRDVNSGLRGEQGPFIYFPLKQHMDRAMGNSIYLLASTRGEALTDLPAIRAVTRSLDPLLPLTSLTTLANRKADYLLPQRMGAALLTALGGLTALLTVLGISGVVAFVIARREREIGIRIALGADRANLVRMVAVGATRPIALGVVIGLGVTAVASRLIGGFLYDVAPVDPATYAAMALALTGIALVAAYLPARRAAAVNPTEALRSE